MLVVSDSWPLQFLIRVQCTAVLPALFSTVLIPPAVEHELNQPTTPHEVRRFLVNRPLWLQVRSPTNVDDHPTLDRGEAAAISLACEVKADAILIDERAGRL